MGFSIDQHPHVFSYWEHIYYKRQQKEIKSNNFFLLFLCYFFLSYFSLSNFLYKKIKFKKHFFLGHACSHVRCDHGIKQTKHSKKNKSRIACCPTHKGVTEIKITLRIIRGRIVQALIQSNLHPCSFP